MYSVIFRDSSGSVQRGTLTVPPIAGSGAFITFRGIVRYVGPSDILTIIPSASGR